MPRTKVNRNPVNSKRVRDNSSELEEFLRDFDIEVENTIQSLQLKLTRDLRDATNNMNQIKKMVPPHIMKMTLKDLKKLTSFAEVTTNENKNNLNVTVKETMSKADEGYITEEQRSILASSSDGEKSMMHQNVSVLGAMRPMRRSRSAMTIATPGPGTSRGMLSAMKTRATPLQAKSSTHLQQPAPHTSRSKYRTPISGLRQKAMSVDRLQTITPKVNPLNPFSMLRHARAGEAIFSLTGSPIVATSIVEQTANINIPMPNGVMSIRPEPIDPSSVLDNSVIQKIDPTVLSHLRTLSANLNILMSGYNSVKPKH
jgi:borealin